ncbi:DNRLRE domain-containing protein [Marinicella litoralis]|uniref:DNRLRE domain-containing protein n=1 Tax=Marinicella litoralis TaxID=644220 RepID=A0A4R6XNC0_9GAMM|nr:DNRLRE domain-containing protein [Marinicella litoralis]TDR19444.1 hypothetical protein C8D91_2000 [Marinicella litoralis]
MKITAVITFVFSTSSVFADTINIPASKDNTLIETTADALSNGAGVYFFVGRTAQQENSIRRGLLKFDLSAIPSGSTINDATLEITSTMSIAGEQNLTLHSLSQDWGESTSNSNASGGGIGAPAEPGDATWTDAYHENIAWLSLGGHYNATASATTAANGTGLVTFNAPGLTSDVQNWFNNPANNFGWIVIGNEASGTTAFRFNSRENASTPPNLVVNFTPPPVVVQLNSVKDNTLFENPFGDTSNGAGSKLFMGKIQSGINRRGLMEFDVSSIPANANISAVTVQLNVLNVPPGSALNGTANLHLALAEWGEGSSVATGGGGGQPAPAEVDDATWLYTFYDDTNPQPWVNSGGDFVIKPSAVTNFGTSTGMINFSSTAELIADVSTWIQNSADNHGWVILGDETNAGNVRSLGSKESGATAPILTIEYNVLDLIFANGFETNE